ncbi:MAG: 4a-hydroxytetrahydrobiopterin dehydratase [Candidatus Vogelbacteria bacterium]|nr:4a-hydroxytetrahydrobiopterin dehydratase [Candidatus Vogelbacteria bacterium]
MGLKDKKCVPCEGGTPPLTEKRAGALRRGLKPEWHLTPDHKLCRVFGFRDFPAAIKFVNQIAALAEAESHHPDLLINYNKVTVTLWTHAIGGLSENDFILAAKIDAFN